MHCGCAALAKTRTWHKKQFLKHLLYYIGAILLLLLLIILFVYLMKNACFVTLGQLCSSIGKDRGKDFLVVLSIPLGIDSRASTLSNRNLFISDQL